MVAAWNGLAIAALAEAGALLGQPAWVDAAAAAAELLLRRAPRRRPAAAQLARRRGRRAGGVLEDYADVAEGLLALHQVTGSRAG